jgi:hypothetical protein
MTLPGNVVVVFLSHINSNVVVVLLYCDWMCCQHAPLVTSVFRVFTAKLHAAATHLEHYVACTAPAVCLVAQLLLANQVRRCTGYFPTTKLPSECHSVTLTTMCCFVFHMSGHYVVDTTVGLLERLLLQPWSSCSLSACIKLDTTAWSCPEVTTVRV